MKQFNTESKNIRLSAIAQSIFGENQIRISPYNAREGQNFTTEVNTEYGAKFMTLMAHNVVANGDSKVIKTPGGTTIAKYNIDTKEVYSTVLDTSLLSEGEEEDFYKELINGIVNNEIGDLTQEEYLVKRAQERKAHNAEEISKLLEARREQEYEAKKERLDSVKGKVVEYRKKFIDASKEEEELTETILNWETKFKEVKEQIAKRINTIFSFPQINRVEFANGKLLVFTEEITVNLTDDFVRSEGHDPEDYAGEYLMGRYKITIDMARKSVKYKNLDRTRHGALSSESQHPHIGEPNNPCLGNAGHAYAMAFKAGDIAGVTLIAINYLESVNLNDSAGEKIGNWPKKQEDGSWRDNNGEF